MNIKEIKEMQMKGIHIAHTLMGFNIFNIILIDKKEGKVEVIKNIRFESEKLMRYIRYRNAKGYDVYAQVPSDMRDIILDLDDLSITVVKSIRDNADFIIETSPGSYHAIFIFYTSMTDEERTQFIKHFGADTSHKKTSTIRLPGFYNVRKRYIVRLIKDNYEKNMRKRKIKGNYEYYMEICNKFNIGSKTEEIKENKTKKVTKTKIKITIDKIQKYWDQMYEKIGDASKVDMKTAILLATQGYNVNEIAEIIQKVTIKRVKSASYYQHTARKAYHYFKTL